MNKNLIAVYEGEYKLMKKQIIGQAVTITVLIILAMISCFYNMIQKAEKKELKELTETQNSMIADLETNCKDLFVEIENLKFGGNE